MVAPALFFTSAPSGVSEITVTSESTYTSTTAVTAGLDTECKVRRVIDAAGSELGTRVYRKIPDKEPYP